MSTYRVTTRNPATNHELTTALKLISSQCRSCGEVMLLLCLEPRCDCLFCEKCEFVDHLCHRRNELFMLMYAQHSLALNGQHDSSQISLIEEHVLPYLRHRVSTGKHPQAYWLSQLDYYQRLEKRLKSLNSLFKTTLEVVAVQRSNINDNEILSSLRDRFRHELANVSFLKEKLRILTEDLNEKVQRFKNKRSGYGGSLPEIERVPLPAIEFIHNTLLFQEKVIYNGFRIPASRLRPRRISTTSEPIFEDPENQPYRLTLTLYPKYPIHAHLKQLTIETASRQISQFSLPEGLQLLEIAIAERTPVHVKFPLTLRKLRIDMTWMRHSSIKVWLQYILLALKKDLSQLKELVLIIDSDHNPDPLLVKALLRTAIAREMRVLTLRKKDEPTLLNAYRNQYRRKLLQVALLERSIFRNSFCRQLILESAELKSETVAVERVSQQYWMDWGPDYQEWRRERQRDEQEFQRSLDEYYMDEYYRFCPCCNGELEQYSYLEHEQQEAQSFVRHIIQRQSKKHYRL